MSRFGNYAIVQPARHELKDEPKLWWEFRPTDSSDELIYQEFYQKNIRVDVVDEKKLYRPPLWIVLMHRQLAITFAGTNIPDDESKPVEKGGAPYLTVEMTVEQREEKIRQMPEMLVEELWAACGESNPLWGPTRVFGKE